MSTWTRRSEGAVTLLTLNRPPINTLDREALEELAKATEEIENDQETQVLVITSEVEGIFCSGGDLKYWRQLSDAEKVSRAGREVFDRIERFSKPTIAAIDGRVIGDGLALALACDFRIASDETEFRLPEVAYGFIPGWGLIHRLVAQVGRANAAELLLTAQPLDIARAWLMGLVNEVVPAHRLQDEVLKRARQMVGLSPAALRAAKCTLRGGNETACFASVWGKEDWGEGIEALLARRTPRFGSAGKGGESGDINRPV